MTAHQVARTSVSVMEFGFRNSLQWTSTRILDTTMDEAEILQDRLKQLQLDRADTGG